MELKLLRNEFPTYTKGKLFIDDIFFCETLEDVNRDKNRNGKFDLGEKKVYGETCIPYGTYKVILSYSPKFKRILPEVLDVQDFTGIRIHRGNKIEDTLGCILCGEKVINGVLKNSTPYEKKLVLTLTNAIQRGDTISLTIKEENYG